MEKVFDLSGGWKLKVTEVENGIANAVIAREDGKFFSVEMSDALGYLMPAIIEEGGKEPCGQVAVIYRKLRGCIEVLARLVDGFNGQTLELSASSISKGQMLQYGFREIGFIQANLKRIQGRIQVVSAEVAEECDFASGFWVYLKDFIEFSEDARSLAALAKTNLLKEM